MHLKKPDPTDQINLSNTAGRQTVPLHVPLKSRYRNEHRKYPVLPVPVDILSAHQHDNKNKLLHLFKADQPMIPFYLHRHSISLNDAIAIKISSFLRQVGKIMTPGLIAAHRVETVHAINTSSSFSINFQAAELSRLEYVITGALIVLLPVTL